MSSRRVQCRRTNASWLLRRALLMPQVKPGPSYRCGKSTFKRAACTPRLGRKRGPEIGHQSPAAQPSPYMYSAYSTYTIVHTQYRPCPQNDVFSQAFMEIAKNALKQETEDEV